MPNFCSLKRQVNKLICNQADNLISVKGGRLRLRRFGIDSNSVAIATNKYGEPVNVTGEVYKEWEFDGIIEKQQLRNDEDSKHGGISDDKEQMLVTIKLDEDVQENDLVEYPINSNHWFKVCQFTETNAQKRTFKAIRSIRSTF